MYVSRDVEGDIVQVSRDPTTECQEWLASDSRELDAFLGHEARRGSISALQSSDLEFVRVLEDLIELLMDKGVISFTDLPDAARDKLMARQSLRQRVNSVDLMDESEDGGGVI